jgi:hypothetical protein
MIWPEMAGWKYISNRTDCRTYSDNGTLTYANRYSIRAGDHNYFDGTICTMIVKYFHVSLKQLIIKTVYNSEEINAIPILVYHNIDYIKNIVHYPILDLELKKQDTLRDLSYFAAGNTTTDVRLFDEEMKYLYDNGFRVITMSDIGYNKTNNHLYIK